MKKFTPILVVLAVAAIVAAIFFFQPKPAPVSVPDTNVYQNEQYAFGFTYPKNMEVRIREEENRQTDYLGFPVDFFISLRDIEREDKPVNIAMFYAAQGLTVDAFKAALEASDPVSVTVTATEDVDVNGLKATKVTSTTAVGIDKTHYLFDRNGQTVVVSVILQEVSTFQPIFDSLKAL